uniref:Reverse transcriptase domain-containing protein n=1 Tax=Sinocyclocheilus grahami TaxID=75366 RepID=A0A672RFP6_SINGR
VEKLKDQLFRLQPPAPDKDLAMNLDAITTTEMAAAIRLLKNNKAPELDMISAEILKHGGHPIIKQLMTLLNTCWAAAQVPEDWRRGVIIKLPKKGNIADCNNWRGITLLSVPGKVFCIVLLRHLRQAVDKKL